MPCVERDKVTTAHCCHIRTSLVPTRSAVLAFWAFRFLDSKWLDLPHGSVPDQAGVRAHRRDPREADEAARLQRAHGIGPHQVGPPRATAGHRHWGPDDVKPRGAEHEHDRPQRTSPDLSLVEE